MLRSRTRKAGSLVNETDVLKAMRSISSSVAGRMVCSMPFSWRTGAVVERIDLRTSSRIPAEAASARHSSITACALARIE